MKHKEFYGERFEEEVIKASNPPEEDKSFEKNYIFEALNWVEKKLDKFIDKYNQYVHSNKSR